MIRVPAQNTSHSTTTVQLPASLSSVRVIIYFECHKSCKVIIFQRGKVASNENKTEKNERHFFGKKKYFKIIQKFFFRQFVRVDL